ncbi:hypothetical protein BHE74_00032574 [Ensete ventricosum]|nr:hypothetical protein BHE74_00032574 [Ensete ventricosum]RZS09746.1 hypothetical protein BHM03_00040849 [Ensete ventricosum]
MRSMPPTSLTPVLRCSAFASTSTQLQVVVATSTVKMVATSSLTHYADPNLDPKVGSSELLTTPPTQHPPPLLHQFRHHLSLSNPFATLHLCQHDVDASDVVQVSRLSRKTNDLVRGRRTVTSMTEHIALQKSYKSKS